MEYKELKSLIIATIVMIATLGALCTATPAMAEGDSLPEVSDQVITNMSVKDIQDFDMIEIDPDPLAYNESLKNSSADFEVCDSAISGKIVGVTITPTRLVSNQYVTYSVYVKNTGTINTCYQLEYYSNGVHANSGFERWINPGDTETFSWRRTMGSTGDREYIFKLYWDRVWYEGSNVLLDTVIVDRYCFAAGLPDIYEPDDDSDYATAIDTNGEAQYHDFHDSGDGDWVKFYMEPGDVCTIETTAIGDRADTYLAFCYYKDFAWQYIYDDDSGVGHGSKITHTCTRSGYHYAKVRQYNSGVYGETTAYSISVSARRDCAPSVIIDPASTTGLSPGDHFSVNISVDPDGNGVASGEICLSFDPAVLEVTNRVKGDMLGTDAFDTGSGYDNTAGTVTAVLACQGVTTPPTAAGTWATVTFQVKAGVADGTTTIVITSVGVVDGDFAPITGITTTGGTATVSTMSLVGDINGDNTVNYIDLGILGASYGLSLGDAGYNVAADLSGDNTVNYIDLGMLGAHYGETCPYRRGGGGGGSE